MTTSKTRLIALTLLLACLTACGRGDNNTNKTQTQNDIAAQLESQQKAAAQTARAYAAMDNAALLKELAEQSAARREPFNSLAYRELSTRKDVTSESLVSLIQETNNADALLPLLLLRKLNEKAYLGLAAELRARVLTDALRTSKMFNVWGLPNRYLEDASKAMLEAGDAALPALKAMLSDTRPAPVFGGPQFAEFQRYKYRLCDYALFFLEKIQGNANFVLPVAPSDRDALIKGLLQ